MKKLDILRNTLAKHFNFVKLCHFLVISVGLYEDSMQLWVIPVGLPRDSNNAKLKF